MDKRHILVVDDEAGMLEVCADILGKLPDVEVNVEADSRRAADWLGRQSFDLLVADIAMPGLTGVELLRRARQQDAGLAAIIMTAFPTVETAVECMRLGAADYVTKPFLPEDLRATALRLLESKRLREENRLLRRQVERPHQFGELLGDSPLMHGVFEKIERLAQTDFDALILGQTGTGKELVARAIHQRSRRRDGPFVPVDCGAIPEQLLEREFFGHERGAFTGAQNRSLGLLEYAKGGTFFLDELTQLPLTLQAKLLRVLQERRIRRVGGTQEIPLNVRVIAASSQSLEEQMKQGRFREDLYHRINVVAIQLPPLHERREDIPLLVNHFLARYCAEINRPMPAVTPDLMEVLTAFCWPGNVRQLQNTLKRMLTMNPQPRLTVADVPDEIVVRAGECFCARKGGFFEVREQRLAAFERDYFRNLLAACRGDVTQAAAEAQMPRGTLYRLLKKHKLEPAEFRDGASKFET